MRNAGSHTLHDDWKSALALCVAGTVVNEMDFPFQVLSDACCTARVLSRRAN